ncbi:MAG: hypothetical protein ANABAC_2500 [Anaerolineae bacterium]|nr:MAG: hypothetical protein ANABAC_2500 [Anaerolineae bacterium]
MRYPINRVRYHSALKDGQIRQIQCIFLVYFFIDIDDLIWLEYT